MFMEIRVFRDGKLNPVFQQDAEQPPSPDELNDLDDLPSWAELSCHQCPKCPLSTDEYRWCPAAAAMVPCAKAAADWNSVEEVTLETANANRRISETMTAANALSAIFSSQIVRSNCPAIQLDFWLWKYFSQTISLENTLFRKLVSNLIYSELSRRKGYDIRPIRTTEEELMEILLHLHMRIHESERILGDAVPNAIVKLHGLSQYSEHFFDTVYEQLEKNLAENKTSKEEPIP